MVAAVAIPPAYQPRLFLLPTEAQNSGERGEMPSAEAAYYASIQHYPVLLPATERMLATRMRSGDTEARHRLYVCNLRFLHSETKRLCRWYGLRPAQQLDVIQHMNLLIWRRMMPSARRAGYDPAVCRFTTWIAGHVFAEMPRAAEVTQALIRRPAYVQTAERRLERDLWDEEAGTGAPDTAHAPSLPWHQLRVASLDGTIGSDEETDGSTLGDSLEDTTAEHQPEAWSSDRVVRQQVAQVIAETPKLTDIQRRILAWHYGLDWPFEQIGKRLGMSKQRVDQIHTRALTNLRVGANTNAALRALRDLL